MKIAVLAWGSLLWSPRELAVDDGMWNEDGPYLPIEFSRIASDGRLTLVIDPAFDEVQVYWKLMKLDDLEKARRNLQTREGADMTDEIGFVNIVDESFCMRGDINYLKDRIFTWVEDKKLDAVIWTDLRPKFFEKTLREFNEISALKYLEELTGETYSRAKEYILKAPPNTKTRLRSFLENFLYNK